MLCIKVEIISIMTSYIALQISVYYTQQIDDSVAASLKVTRKAKGKSRKFKFFGNQRADTCMRVWTPYLSFFFEVKYFKKLPQPRFLFRGPRLYTKIVMRYKYSIFSGNEKSSKNSRLNVLCIGK